MLITPGILLILGPFSWQSKGTRAHVCVCAHAHMLILMYVLEIESILTPPISDSAFQSSSLPLPFHICFSYFLTLIIQIGIFVKTTIEIGPFQCII